MILLDGLLLCPDKEWIVIVVKLTDSLLTRSLSAELIMVWNREIMCFAHV